MNIPIQASISGYGGQPCTLLSMYDSETGQLLAYKIVPFEQTRRPRALMVAVTARIPHDTLFTTEDLGQGITAFERMRDRIEFKPEAMRADPSGQIEIDGYTESGVQRRINGELTNEKVAMLATCFAAVGQETTNAALDMMDAITALASGGVLTIGGDDTDDGSVW